MTNKININFEIKNKKRVAIMGTIAFGLLAYTIVDAILSPTPPVPKNDGHVVLDSQKSSKENGTAANGSEETGVQVSAMQNTNDFTVNPFLEIKEFDISKGNIADMSAAGKGNFVPPAIPRGGYNIPLPTIPNHQAGSIDIGTNMPANISDFRRQQDKISVQGVATGDNGNIAIMGDGRVVSEGDIYKDDRIAYIGGDGIVFDNGKKISYE